MTKNSGSISSVRYSFKWKVYLHVEVSCKGNEHEKYRNDETSSNPGSQMRFEVVEFDPTQNAYFD